MANTTSRKAAMKQAKLRGAKIQARRNITQMDATPRMAFRSMKKQVSRSMSKASADYVRLLTDPCNAPLVPGIYPGSGGGIVSRFETDFLIGTTATDTCASFTWVPGMNLTFAPSIALPLDSTAFTPAIGAVGSMPGYNFLNTVAGSFRAISACMQVTYPGSELDRSGIISLGIQDGASIIPFLPTTQGGSAVATNVQQLRSMAQHTERTPATTAEIIWMPGEFDGQNFSYGLIGPPPKYPGPGDGVMFQGRNALVFTAASLPLGIGVRLRCVLVCEWTPRVNQGIVASVNPTYSAETVAEVLAKLARSNPNWYIHASNIASSLYSNLSSQRRRQHFIDL